MNFTNEEIAALRASFLKLIPVSEALSIEFYERLFREHPEVRSNFRPDMQAQQDKLIDTLAALIDVLNQPTTAETVLKDLGQRHVVYGATPELYAWVEVNLRSVMAELAGKEEFVAVEPLWTRLLSYVTTTMQAGHA
jgi:hemoglobin-like flavoprotein